MKRIVTILLIAALALCLLAGCGGKPSGGSKSPEELTKSYVDAITGARDEEYNEAFPIVSDLKDEMAEPLLGMMGLSSDDVTAFALSVSLRNMQAYGVCAAMPADGKADTVKEAFQNFIDIQKSNFEFYLEDQYEVAKAAKLETLSDGTVLMVLCENQDDVLASIKKSLG